MLWCQAAQMTVLSNRKLKSVLTCTVWSQFTPVPDRQTNRRTNIITPARRFVLTNASRAKNADVLSRAASGLFKGQFRTAQVVERRRRENRGAEGAEGCPLPNGGGVWGGGSAPSPENFWFFNQKLRLSVHSGHYFLQFSWLSRAKISTTAPTHSK